MYLVNHAAEIALCNINKLPLQLNYLRDMISFIYCVFGNCFWWGGWDSSRVSQGFIKNSHAEGQTAKSDLI
jgi:hypothetical protein